VIGQLVIAYIKDERMLQHHTVGFKFIEYNLQEAISMAPGIQICDDMP
jgi:hypothetical protein